MITIFKTVNHQLVKSDTIEEGVWIHLHKPTREEIEEISEAFDIESSGILAALDEEERARIDQEDNYTLILMDVPIIEEAHDTEFYTTIPFGILLTAKAVITVCLKEPPFLKDFTNDRIKGFHTYKKTRIILQILYKVASSYLQFLRMIDKKSIRIEQALHKSLKNKELIQLLDLEKSLVYFTTSLRSNEVVLKRMMRLDSIKHYPDDQELLEDVIIENEQAIEMSNIYSNILSGTMDAYASVISNNLNMVMKFLTSVTIIMAIPTMIASFFGMNVPMPFSTHSYAFLMIMLISLMISSIFAFIMFKKKLF